MRHANDEEMPLVTAVRSLPPLAWRDTKLASVREPAWTGLMYDGRRPFAQRQQ